MSGVKIDKVFEGTAAYDCGIRTGDTVLEIANVKITHPLHIYSVLSKQTDTEFADIKVLRGEQELLYTMHIHDDKTLS